jgi:Core-2/I-Branching enzyme
MPEAPDPTPPEPASIACVVLAHGDPAHLRRLVDALAPFPVFLHVDSATPEATFSSMTEGLPARCRLLPRLRTGWAGWGIVEAELSGYRRALAETDASHIVLLQGSDYPLVPTAEIADVLRGFAGRTLMQLFPMPNPDWGRSGGLSRLRYRHWAIRRRMIRLPLPRRLPRGLTLGGGSPLKVLAREHAEAVLRVFDERKDLVRFWRRSWAPDETFIPTLLSSPSLVPEAAGRVVADSPWWIRWTLNSKSPAWIGPEDLEAVLSRKVYPNQPRASLFARKFRTGLSDEVLDAIDAVRLASAAQLSGRTAS